MTAKEKLTRGIVLALTDQELELLRQLAQLEGTESRNVLRRAILARAKEQGLEIPDGAFEDRKKGNFLPKSDRQQPIKPLAVTQTLTPA